MILLHGLEDDAPLAAVYNAIKKLGQPVMFLDQSKIAETEIDLTVGSSIEGWIKLDNQTLDLRSVTSAYLRPYDSRQLPDVERSGQGSSLWDHALLLEDVLFSWAELTQALVINRPMSMASNNSKPFQSIKIKSSGFDIPDTLVTTDPQAVLEFWNMHGTIIYKSISGIRSIVSRFTRDHLDRIENIKWCPTQFQEYIPGNDYRVHIVDDEIFACQIISKADDYRYAARQNCTVAIKPYVLPDDVAQKCKKLVKSLDLVLAGIDLRQTPDGKWCCFEVNPSPGFTYYQEEAGQPIDQAIAHLLMRNGSR